MSDETDTTPDELEIAIEQGLAASALGPLTQRVEGVAQILVDHPMTEKLTMLKDRDEAIAYAKMTYLEHLIGAVAQEDEKGFSFPTFQDDLISPDYQLRTSVKQQTRKILESITKIFEREGGQKGGIFGWGRKG